MTGAPLTVRLSVSAPRSKLGVDGGGETDTDADALADDRRESCELEGEPIISWRYGWKTVGAAPSVSTVWLVSSVGPASVTDTPGTTALVLSVTVP